MEALIIVNYALFAITLSLLTVELGVALLFLFRQEEYGDVAMGYLGSIWGITGTFIIFFLVNFAATYPDLLPIVAAIYSAPIILFAVIIIIRNSFLAYSELIGSKKSKSLFRKVYGVSTLLIILLIISATTSIITGTAVNQSSQTVNLAYMILNPFNILLFVSLLALACFCVTVFFTVRNPRLFITSLTVSVLVPLIAMHAYLPYVCSSILGNPLAFLPSAAFLVAICIMYLRRDWRARLLVIPLVFFTFLTLELLSYPYLFGGSTLITGYLTPPVSGSYVAYITVIGGTLLVVALAYFVYVQHLRKQAG